MIIKSYEIKKNLSTFSKKNFFLLYGENIGLKKDIRNTIKNLIKEKDDKLEILSLYENEVLNNEENFYDLVYSGSLFSNKKVITISESTDKIFNKISDIYNKYTDNVFIIIFAGILEKKSKLRGFFEKEKNAICIPCYLDSEKDLEIIAQTELKKNKISLSREIINLLIEQSNSDRNNLRNEIEKIKSYSINKKQLEIDEIKLLINFSGDYKSEALINACLCGNIIKYKKILSEVFSNAANQILLLRILTNKIHRLLNIKIQEKESNNLDNLINTSKPPIFWKEKPLVKKQLTIWTIKDLKKIIANVNKTELLCKKNPNVSEIIFFDFFLGICIKANNYS